MSRIDDGDPWRRERNRAYVFRDLLGKVEELHGLLLPRHRIFYVERGMGGDIRDLIKDALSDLWGACESSLEQITGTELLRYDYGSRANGIPRILRSAKFDDEFDNGVTICPQMAFPHVRVDFGIVVKAGDAKKIIAIECDGEEYHKDKARDKRRDAHVARYDVEVIRISSAEWSPEIVEQRLCKQLHRWWL